MCYREIEHEEFVQSIRRNEARRRAETANKCEALRAIDEAIERMRNEGKNLCIGEVLKAARDRVDAANAGAGDTLKRLLALEGW